MREMNSSCVMSGTGLLLMTVRLSVSSTQTHLTRHNDKLTGEGWDSPAWSTQALGTPASGQTLQ